MLKRYNKCVHIFLKGVSRCICTVRTVVDSKLRSLGYYLHQLLLLKGKMAEYSRTSEAHSSSRASLVRQPGLLVSPASPSKNATVFAHTCQSCHPGFSLLAAGQQAVLWPQGPSEEPSWSAAMSGSSAPCKKSLSIQ